MVFGQLKIGILEVHVFNNSLNLLWSNPDPKEEDDTIVLIDISGSMRNHKELLKLIASVLKCCSNTQGKWNLPTPNGSTGLVDAVNHVHAMDLADTPKVLIVSDGMDTASRAEQLVKSIRVDGTPEFQEFRKKFDSVLDWIADNYTLDEQAGMDDAQKKEIMAKYYEERKAFYESKCKAVATHISNLQMEMVVLAVGSEVKDFVAAMSKPGQRINVAHIELGATASDVVRQVAEVVRRPRRAAGNEVAAEVVTARSATVGVEDMESAVRAVNREAGNTTVGEAPMVAKYDPESMVRYIDAVCADQCAKFWQDPQCIREALLAYYKFALEHRSIPGNLLNSKYGGFFCDPSKVDGRKGQFGACINSCLSLLYKNAPDSVASDFSDELAVGKVGPMFNTLGSKDSVTRISSNSVYKAGYNLPEDAMYFGATKAPHYTVHVNMNNFIEEFEAAARSAGWPVSRESKKLQLWKGNISEDTYMAKRSDEAVSNGSTGSSGKKRTIEDLETEVADLKKENIETLSSLVDLVDAVFGKEYAKLPELEARLKRMKDAAN